MALTANDLDVNSTGFEAAREPLLAVCVRCYAQQGWCRRDVARGRLGHRLSGLGPPMRPSRTLGTENGAEEGDWEDG